MAKRHVTAEQLIPLVEKKPVLWDRCLKSYRDLNLRTEAWRDICYALDEEFDNMEEDDKVEYSKSVVKKWNHIRDSWMKSISFKKYTKKSGAPSRKYLHHDQLLFLKKILQPNKAQMCDNIKVEMRTQSSEEEEEDISVSPHEETEVYFFNEVPGQDGPENGAKRTKRNDDVGHILNVSNQQEEDRNMSFFKSVLPTLALFDDDQILEFQAGVISLLRNIKKRNDWDSGPSTSH